MANTVDGGGWFSLRAAGRLGISERTARRRVKQGDLRGRQVASPRGPMWEVWLDDAAPAASVDGQASQVAMVEALRMMEQLQAELLRRTEAAATWQARAEVLAAQLHRAQETIRALEAPREAPADAPESHTAGRGTASSAGVDSDTIPTPAAPWWRRAWARLAGT